MYARLGLYLSNLPTALNIAHVTRSFNLRPSISHEWKHHSKIQRWNKFDSFSREKLSECNNEYIICPYTRIHPFSTQDASNSALSEPEWSHVFFSDTNITNGVEPGSSAFGKFWVNFLAMSHHGKTHLGGLAREDKTGVGIFFFELPLGVVLQRYVCWLVYLPMIEH